MSEGVNYEGDADPGWGLRLHRALTGESRSHGGVAAHENRRMIHLVLEEWILKWDARLCASDLTDGYEGYQRKCRDEAHGSITRRHLVSADSLCHETRGQREC
jgi:hypothetical protein